MPSSLPGAARFPSGMPYWAVGVVRGLIGCLSGITHLECILASRIGRRLSSLEVAGPGVVGRSFLHSLGGCYASGGLKTVGYASVFLAWPGRRGV